MMGRPYASQLVTKRERLDTALARYPHLALPEPGPIVAAATVAAYRHRLKLPVEVGVDRVSIGLYGPNHRVLDTPDCPVLAEPLRAALPPILDWLRGRPSVHSLDLRVSRATGELMLVVACAHGQLPGGPHAARELRRRVPQLASVAVSRADPDGKRVMGRAPQVVAGKEFIEERVGRTSYRLHPGAFFQVDPAQAEVLHDWVAGFVGDANTVLDLYAGVGAYGLMLAPGRQRVVLVEEVPQAAAGAAAVAPPNVQIVTSKVEDAAFTDRFDAVILNPARRGSDLRTLAQIAAITDRLVYVSCGPETLARDLDILAAFGLRVENIVPVDLFPQTPEVETVVKLVRGPPVVRWRGPGGFAHSPWVDRRASGAVGRPTRALVLVLGETRPRGTLDGATYERVGFVAGHSLLRLTLRTTLARAMAGLKARGHAIAGKDPRTAAFFAEKGGLVRPFVHVEADVDGNVVPLHGDLAEAVDALGGVQASPPPMRPRRRH